MTTPDGKRDRQSLALFAKMSQLLKTHPSTVVYNPSALSLVEFRSHSM